MRRERESYQSSSEGSCGVFKFVMRDDCCGGACTIDGLIDIVSDGLNLSVKWKRREEEEDRRGASASQSKVDPPSRESTESSLLASCRDLPPPSSRAYITL